MQNTFFFRIVALAVLCLTSTNSVFAVDKNLKKEKHQTDVVLIGAGIMSATLGTLLRELDPTLKIEVFERLSDVAAESSDTWNNAGTGHSALCELNYTPLKPDGTVDISKAVQINESFEISKQFWSYLTHYQGIGEPRSFINPVPHLSWVHGQEDVDFLRKRYEALHKVSLFEHMEYSEDPKVLEKWMPLVMHGRDAAVPVAATRSALGTDIDFGKLTHLMLSHLEKSKQAAVFLSHEVRDLRRSKDGTWQIKVRDLRAKKTRTIKAKFVFVGAGGGTLPLLQKSGIPEAQGYGGFPVSGQFLVSKNLALATEQNAKVYGKAPVGSPPMSVPHLDTRVIGGQRMLLFGPFAGVTTKFLKNSSSWDLVKSVQLDNLSTMLGAGWQNIPLIGYLINQETQSHEDRVQALREFLPNAKPEDWTLITAGQRVQVLKQEPGREDVLRFGTEVVSSEDGSIIALLGASPGASTSVSIMLDVLKKSFADKMNSKEWKQKLAQMIPSYGHDLAKNSKLTEAVRYWTTLALHLSLPKTCKDGLMP